jgi:hypothetical protein
MLHGAPLPPGELAAPVPVIAETFWLILDRLGTAAQAAFIRLITSTLGELLGFGCRHCNWWDTQEPGFGILGDSSAM